MRQAHWIAAAVAVAALAGCNRPANNDTTGGVSGGGTQTGAAPTTTDTSMQGGMGTAKDTSKASMGTADTSRIPGRDSSHPRGSANP
jgi:hypothetical protein